MVSKEKGYGVFLHNDLLKDYPRGQNQRTALLGQVVIIDAKLPNRILIIRFLKEGETWESVQFCCSEDSVIRICEKLCFFIASIVSPQERVKVAKNKSLCDKLKTITNDMTVGFADTKDVYLGKVKYIGVVKGMGHCFGIELHVSVNMNINIQIRYEFLSIYTNKNINVLRINSILFFKNLSHVRYDKLIMIEKH